MSVHTLYGSPLSLYTGKARSYLIKNGVSYREVAPTTKHYLEEVLPKAGQRNSMPTIALRQFAIEIEGAVQPLGGEPPVETWIWRLDDPAGPSD